MDLYSPLEADKFYHIYNRGINGGNIFFEEKNYSYFLQKFFQFLNPVVNTLAYCLLRNHFHFLIQIKRVSELEAVFRRSTLLNKSFKSEGLHSADFVVSKQFAKFFSSYTQGINKVYSRTGSLFESPFKRIEINDDDYLTKLIWYIHFNPQKHGFVDDFRGYSHSSYQNHLSIEQSNMKRDSVISWFGGRKEYERFHRDIYEDQLLEKMMIEN